LSNITRPDEVDESSMLSQQQALANAPKHHKGYFVVARIIEK
jgi:Asp-tRNA(Asn)/Glu-tRNA(Gln) amidotransferase C subunit